MNPAGVRVVFMGSPEFAVPALEGLAAAGYIVAGVFTQPDRPGGRGNRLIAPPVKVAAARLGLEVFQPESLRRGEALAALRTLAPDLIVVAAYGQILRPAVLALPRYGCINVHASLLPRHRGASPIAAAILAGDPVTGCSIMQIDRGLDTGPVIAQRALAIAPEDTTGTLTEKLSGLGAALLLETVPGWLAGTLPAQPQAEAGATYAPQLDKESARIDWAKPAERLWREVRAFNPWPLSFTYLGTDLLQILACAPLVAGAGATEHTPGTVVTLPAGELEPDLQRRAGFAVVTGDGLLVPLLVRRAGRNTVRGNEFARGVRELIGRRLSAEPG